MKLNKNDLEIGQIVRSTAGRDKGSWLLVIDIIDDDYVFVCNGSNRKVSNPKKKKIKHLARTNRVDKSIRERKQNGIKVGNAEVRKLLQPFIEKDSPDKQE